MNMESLDDDNFEVFKGGTLEINQETSIRLSGNNSPDSNNSSGLKETVLNDNDSTGMWRGSNLINIPKRLTETLWSCKNNNNNLNGSSQAVANFANVTAAISNDNVQDYFTFRDEVVEKSVIDCVNSLINPNDDGELIATFLLTEITTWDAEKERLLILTKRALYSVKYDFIALKQLDHRRVALNTLDAIIIGDLVYPSTSLVPRLNGLATGVSNVMKGCLLERWSQQQQQQKQNTDQSNQQQKTLFDTTNLFEPRDRKTHGVRILWNGDVPVAFTQRWNPFNSDVPFITFISHPLYRHADSLNDNQKSTFSVDVFCRQLIEAVETNKITTENEASCNRCLIHHKDIVLQTYVGLGSLIYNRNALGFFKVRGKFSF